ncbi:DNA topoisomerase IV subunit A [Falsarthrobacter nasiphocae]|uniref:DNA topoisomerase (ATP-hydrolyzing) n=1 Tax=Falsarthrobacter nasiphocae TaxID=189863 RepID=A0AAE3YEK1_9MICC|nr:DNA topoisomerase IV subunit A [Falsarthrobacter nasiphocae]MDR6891272.1 DNA gyrase subunit A [Falsarthrobacter nasiphocae]
MAPAPKSRQVDSAADGTIIDVDVAEEMESSFLEYAYSVIYSRALPDARDGLKPVQRRILYMMSEMGLRPDRGHVKSARVVGEVMGKLHPHGDGAIYDAMVRMAQSFSLRLPLIDGHGNFGSLDDGPAAARYTEARLAPSALTLTSNLDENVVDFEPNYDGQLTQPTVLPAAFPNLLVNGASGIAVGMATNMAPHNLREVVAAARLLVENPSASLEDVMALVPGPDLPSGGIIVGLDGIRDAYRTGRGTFKTRAAVAIEQLGPRKTGLVVTELPYGVGPEKVIEKIKDAVNAKKLVGIANVIDLSDRKHGLRLVIELKNGFNPNAVLAQLYRFTPMEDSFGINNVCLVDGQPQTLGLLDLLRVYTDHRLDVVRRRTAFRLQKKQDRLHLVDGLLLALVDIDEVIEIIRSSDDSAEAKRRLIQIFDLSEVQAEYILELRLRQLTKFSRIDLERERDELRAAIAELEEILASDSRLRQVVSDELAALAEEHGTERRTVLKETADDAPLPGTSPALTGGPASKAAPLSLKIADDPCFAVLTATGLIGRTLTDEPVSDETPRAKHDVLLSVVPTTARAEIAVLTDRGRMVRLPVLDMPSFAAGPKGLPSLTSGGKVADYAALAKGESVVALVPLDRVIALGTRNGVVKRVNPEYPLNSDEWEAISLKPGDSVVAAHIAPDDADLAFLTERAQLLRFPASAVRAQGRTAGGMAGIKLAEGDAVIAFGVVDPAQKNVVVTVSKPDDALPGLSSGSVKLTDADEFPVKGRATAGVRAHRFLKGEEGLSLGYVGPIPARASSKNGVHRVLPTEYGRRDGSGVPLQHSIDLIGGSMLSAADAPRLATGGRAPDGGAAAGASSSDDGTAGPNAAGGGAGESLF